MAISGERKGDELKHELKGVVKGVEHSGESSGSVVGLLDVVKGVVSPENPLLRVSDFCGVSGDEKKDSFTMPVVLLLTPFMIFSSLGAIDFTVFAQELQTRSVLFTSNKSNWRTASSLV